MRWYEGIWWVVLFACFLLYIAKHPENFTRYYGNKRGNLLPFNISIFYGKAVPRFPINRRFSMVFSAFIFLVIAACHKDISEGRLSGAV